VAVPKSAKSAGSKKGGESQAAFHLPGWVGSLPARPLDGTSASDDPATRQEAGVHGLILKYHEERNGVNANRDEWRRAEASYEAYWAQLKCGVDPAYRESSAPSCGENRVFAVSAILLQLLLKRSHISAVTRSRNYKNIRFDCADARVDMRPTQFGQNNIQ